MQIRPWAGSARACALAGASVAVTALGALGAGAPPQIPIVETIPLIPGTPGGAIVAIDGDDEGLIASVGPSSSTPEQVFAAERSPVDASWTIVPIAPPDATSWFLWGNGVARDDGRIAIGAPGRLLGGTSIGGVLILEQSETGWTAGQAIDGTEPGALFGWSVALDGDSLVVGSLLEEVEGAPQAGAVRVFRRFAEGWSLVQTLTSDLPQAGERFGHAVALDGDRLVIGGPNSNRAGPPLSGAAWVYAKGVDGTFSLETVLTSPLPAVNDALGSAVAIAGDLLAVGVPNADIAGSNRGALLAGLRTDDGRADAWSVTLIGAPLEILDPGFGTSVAAWPDRIAGSATMNPRTVTFAPAGGAWQLEYQTTLLGPLATRGPDLLGRGSIDDSTLLVSPIGRDCDGDGIQDQLAVIAGLVEDCDENLVPDSCEIAADRASDLDGDGRLDRCPLVRIVLPTPIEGFPPFTTLFTHVIARDSTAIVQLIRVQSTGGVGGIATPLLLTFDDTSPSAVATPIEAWGMAPFWSMTPYALESSWCAHRIAPPAAPQGLAIQDIAPDGSLSLAATFTGSGALDLFGVNLASTEDELLASTAWDPNEAYPIRRFVRDAKGGWSEAQPIHLDDASWATGIAIARDGATVAIADLDPGDGMGAPGSVRIGTIAADGTWIEETRLRAPNDGVPTGTFGAPLRVAGERVIVGGRTDSAMRRLFIYRRVQPGSWTLEESFAFDSFAGPFSRRSIATRGTEILVAGSLGGIDRFRRAANGAWIAEAPLLSSVVGWKLGLGAAWLGDGRILAVARGPDTEAWLLDPVVDCNGNGVNDRVDIGSGSSADANANGVPDDCEIVGDMNVDGVVDAIDLALLLGRWGLAGWGDLDDDGAVGSSDLALLLATFGTQR